MSHIETFVANCYVSPERRTAAVDLVPLIRASIPAVERRNWPRGRILAELARLGFPAGVAGDHKTYIAGLSLDRPTAWAVENGKLVKV